MPYLILLASIIGNNFQIDQINYYYFTTEGCIPCKRQLPIIQKLHEEGFYFDIVNDPKLFENFEITAFPTIVIELIDYKQRKIKQIKLVGFHSYNKLKAILLKITNRSAVNNG